MKAPTQKWTEHLQHVIEHAHELASQTGLNHVLPTHLLLSISHATDSLGAALLKKTNFDNLSLENYLRTTKPNDTPASLSPAAQQIIFSAINLAFKARHSHVGTEHLLMAMIKNPSPDLVSFIKISDWKIQNLEQQLQMVFKSNSKLSELTDSFFDDLEDEISEEDDVIPPNLLSVGTHLTNPQRIKEMDPVVGREKELDRLLQILSRRTKNNPVLLGEPGVGKTALVEALAQKINSSQVPLDLLNKKIVSLEVGSLVAGTMYRGEFEQRLKNVVNEIIERKDIILFIDELHTIVGAGAANGSVDAANILKPALARGQIRCIGATTLAEYRQYIENDGALERRFQPITVNEPSSAEARQMLAGLKNKYEQHHAVTVPENILDMAVEMAERHIPERFLPDKAIDLLDEAAAKTKLESPAPKEAIEIVNLKQQIKEAHKRKEKAVMSESFEQAIKYKNEILLLEDKLKELENYLNRNKKAYPTVTPKTLAEVISNWTGIQVAQYDQSNKEALKNLDKNLSKHVVGQMNALSTVAHILKRARLGLSTERRPLASFLLVGPSGVGKTTLAKAIAQELFGDQKAILKLDMSEYSESYSTSKLIGSPAGYVGYKESGFLTEQVRRRPHQVILFDELDKAHLDIVHLLQQILDEGSLRDSAGKLVNFKQTIIVATANPNRDQKNLGFGNGVRQIDSFGDLAHIFSSELRDRFDAVVPLQTLSEDALSQILDRELSELNRRLQAQTCALKITNRAKKYLIGSSNGGARQLRQMFTEHAEHAIATKLTEIKKNKKNYTLDYNTNTWDIT